MVTNPFKIKNSILGATLEVDPARFDVAEEVPLQETVPSFKKFLTKNERILREIMLADEVPMDAPAAAQADPVTETETRNDRSEPGVPVYCYAFAKGKNH